MKKFNPLTRRQALAVSGTAAALPWLEALSGPQKAWSAPVPGFTIDGHPKRVVLFGSVLGSNPLEYIEDDNVTYKRIMKPLERHRNLVTLVKGYTNTDEDAGDHAGGEVGCLSGWGRAGGAARGPSLDQRIRNDLNPNTREGMLYTSYADPGRPIKEFSTRSSGKSNSPIRSPYTVFDKLFKGLSEGAITTGDPNLEIMRRARLDILDKTHLSYKQLKGKLGREDIDRLDIHINALENMLKNLNNMEDMQQQNNNSCSAPKMGLHKQLPNRNGRLYERRPDNYADQKKKEPLDEAIANTYMDLFAHSFACDFTRIVTFVAGELHSHLNASHKMYANNRSKNKDAYDSVVDSSAAVARRMAYLVDKLKAIPEGNGSVMDNTIFMWTHSLANGAGHKKHDSRQVIVGSAGAFDIPTGGQVINAPGKEIFHTPVLTTVAQAMGIETDHQGDPRWKKGALPGIRIKG